MRPVRRLRRDPLFIRELSEGSTALSLAARHGHDDVVRLLLDRRAGLEIQRQDGTTALMEAAAYNHAAAVRVLLSYGANASTARKGGRVDQLRPLCTALQSMGTRRA